MSFIEILDADGVRRKVDVVSRTEGSETILSQATAIIDPTTGNVLRPNADGSFNLSATQLAALASEDTVAAGLGAPADAEATGNGSIIAILKRIRTRLSGTLAISADSLPLPANAAAETGGNLEAISADLGAPADASASSDTGPFSITALIKRLLTKMPALVNGRQPSLIAATNVDYWPGYAGAETAGESTLTVDNGGALVTRGAVLTDEGTFRVNFANNSLAVTIGNVAVSGVTVTGSGFLTSDVHYKDYFKLDADGESAWTQIKSVDSDTQITLRAAYPGGTSGGASRALVRPVTGAGGAISVASGVCTITSGTTNNAITRIARFVDYAPLVFRGVITVSQRIANQTIRIGLSEPFTATDRWFARFRLDGTTNTTVICETGRNPTGVPSAAETETTTVTLPNGATTAAGNLYRVELLTERVVFWINGIQVAEHSRVIPAQHDEMETSVTVINGTSAASSTTITTDYVTSKNHNKLEVGVLSDAEQIIAAEVPLRPFNYNVAGVIAINTDVLIIPCAQFRTINLQATSIGTTGRLDFFSTNDLSVIGTAQPAYPIGGGVGVTTTTAAGHWNIPTNGAAFLRVRMGVATTAGTTTIFANGSQSAHPIPAPTTQPVSLATNTPTLAAGTNLAGDVGIQYRASAAGAASVAKIIAAASTNATNVKASAGRLLGWQLQNTTASIVYVKLHNQNVAPTAGASVLFPIAIPANGKTEVTLEGGVAFGTGIGYTIVTGSSDADATAVTAGAVVGTLKFL